RVTHRVAVGEPLAPARLSALSSALGTPSQTPVGDGQSVPGPDVNGPGLSHEQTDAWSEFCRTVPRAAERLDRAAARMPRPGDRFLNFDLRAELGRGAFGRVFLARQGDLAQRWVALKVAPDLWGESQTLAQLQHTHIVPVYSVHQAGPLQAV